MTPPKRNSKSEPKTTNVKTSQKQDVATKVDEKPVESPVDNASDKTDDTVETTVEKPSSEPSQPIETSTVPQANHRFKAGMTWVFFKSFLQSSWDFDWLEKSKSRIEKKFNSQSKKPLHNLKEKTIFKI